MASNSNRIRPRGNSVRSQSAYLCTKYDIPESEIELLLKLHTYNFTVLRPLKSTNIFKPKRVGKWYERREHRRERYLKIRTSKKPLLTDQTCWHVTARGDPCQRRVRMGDSKMCTKHISARDRDVAERLERLAKKTLVNYSRFPIAEYSDLFHSQTTDLLYNGVGKVVGVLLRGAPNDVCYFCQLDEKTAKICLENEIPIDVNWLSNYDRVDQSRTVTGP